MAEKKKTKKKLKVKKGVKDLFTLIGITSVSLIVLALFIVLGEQFEIIQFYVGDGLLGLSPLDIWLVIVLLIFAPAMFGSYYLLYKLKVVKI